MKQPIPTELLVGCCLAIIASLLTGCTATDDATLTGTVSRVWDGDTVDLMVAGRTHRVRLHGIDAPEHDQPWGDESRARLESVVRGRSVRLDVFGTDAYDRLLGTLWVEPADCPGCGYTLNVNHLLVLEGLAWWYRRYADEQTPEDRGRFESAEQAARARRIGLWQQPDPVPPWRWKHGGREASTDRNDCRIKGNISENGRIYHLPGQKNYDRTRISTARGERWFCSEAEARAAGWRKARR